MAARLLAFLATVVLSALTGIAAHAGECGSEATYKSPPGGIASDISFHNGSGEQRRVYWLDESGQRKLKVVVDAGQTQRQSTIASHVWVVTDGNEKCLYVIEASSAAITVEIGGGAAAPAASAPSAPAPAAQTAPAAQPPVSPIAKFGLSGWYQIASLSKPGRVLNNLESGKPEIERVKDEWESAYWEFEEVRGTEFVTIKNKWTRKYLGVKGTDGLGTVETANQGDGAQWTIESAGDGLSARLKSRFNGRYLAATPSGFEFAQQPPPGNGGLWRFTRSSQEITPEPAPVAETKARPRRDDDDDKPSKTRSRKCPKGERFDEDRLDCVSIKCGRHQVYSKAEGQCLDKSDTCSKHEVYSSSMQQCIPKSAMCDKGQVYSSSVGACIAKSQPKPPPAPAPVQPKPPKCAYKTDGAGNCLTPAFLQCQKAFGACMKACGNKAGKCEANCEAKYAGTCGD